MIKIRFCEFKYLLSRVYKIIFCQCSLLLLFGISPSNTYLSWTPCICINNHFHKIQITFSSRVTLVVVLADPALSQHFPQSESHVVKVARGVVIGHNLETSVQRLLHHGIVQKGLQFVQLLI